MLQKVVEIKDRPETLPSLISKLAIGHDPKSATFPPILTAYFVSVLT